MAQAARRGGNGERGDVAVPGEVVWFEGQGFGRRVRVDGGGVRGGFEFAEDWRLSALWVLGGRERGREVL